MSLPLIYSVNDKKYKMPNDPQKDINEFTALCYTHQYQKAVELLNIYLNGPNENLALFIKEFKNAPFFLKTVCSDLKRQIQKKYLEPLYFHYASYLEKKRNYKSTAGETFFTRSKKEEQKQYAREYNKIKESLPPEYHFNDEYIILKFLIESFHPLFSENQLKKLFLSVCDLNHDKFIPILNTLLTNDHLAQHPNNQVNWVTQALKNILNFPAIPYFPIFFSRPNLQLAKFLIKKNDYQFSPDLWGLLINRMLSDENKFEHEFNKKQIKELVMGYRSTGILICESLLHHEHTQIDPQQASVLLSIILLQLLHANIKQIKDSEAKHIELVMFCLLNGAKIDIKALERLKGHIYYINYIMSYQEIRAEDFSRFDKKIKLKDDNHSYQSINLEEYPSLLLEFLWHIHRLQQKNANFSFPQFIKDNCFLDMIKFHHLNEAEDFNNSIFNFLLAYRRNVLEKKLPKLPKTICHSILLFAEKNQYARYQDLLPKLTTTMAGLK